MGWLDFNKDGTVTISDIFLHLKHIACYPGNAVIDVATGTSVGNFFEITAMDAYGTLAWFVSVICWIIVSLFVISFVD